MSTPDPVVVEAGAKVLMCTCTQFGPNRCMWHTIEGGMPGTARMRATAVIAAVEPLLHDESGEWHPHSAVGPLRLIEAEAAVARLRELADALAGSLALMLYDAHPVYGNTTGWRGGIGGQTITGGCSVIDPPPGADWTQMDLLSTALREYMAEYPFDLDAAKEREKARALAMLHPKEES